MELKYLSREHVTVRKVSSNRTFMELKYTYDDLHLPFIEF